MAYVVEMISIEKVVSSVKRFSNFSASKELPFDLEDAMVFWINKVRNKKIDVLLVVSVSFVSLICSVCLLQVNIKMREIAAKEMKMKHHLLESPSHQKVAPCVSVLYPCLTFSSAVTGWVSNSRFLMHILEY